MSTRDIVAAFDEMYSADISAGLVSQITNAVVEQVVEWQSRPLDVVYPIVYMDCIVLKIRQDKRGIMALGINVEAHKELLGMWMSKNEWAKFWLSVLTDLQNRGVKHVLIACVDGLKGFPEVINASFPDASAQLCIVHMVRNSLKFVPWKLPLLLAPLTLHLRPAGKRLQGSHYRLETYLPVSHRRGSRF
ncbi:MAG: transposase-like protein [Granulosicoccus sp.]|jgi:transposase-like protein